jgi:hypothetical protein
VTGAFSGAHTTSNTCGKQSGKEKAPMCGAFVVGGTGLEPVTPSLSSLSEPTRPCGTPHGYAKQPRLDMAWDGWGEVASGAQLARKAGFGDPTRRLPQICHKDLTLRRCTTGLSL